MRRVLRWVLAGGATLAGFALVWWASESAAGLERGVAVSVAAVAAPTLAGGLAWRAGRVAPGGPPAVGNAAQPWHLVPVARCRAEDIGVHGAGVQQPVYVARDHDAELRRQLQAAMVDGGLVVVVGDSSTGKSRSLWEVARDIMPQWRLLLVDTPESLARAGASVPPNTLVLIDDTPSVRFLAPGGLTRAGVLALTRQGTDAGPVVVVYLVWLGPFGEMSAPPQRSGARSPGSAAQDAGQRDGWRDARAVLALASGPAIRVPAQFSPEERHRVQQKIIAGRDWRLTTALADARYGVTQHLAGAPHLMAHWLDAETAQPYGWALLTAAVDIRRLGVQAPLTIDMLAAIAPAYLTDAQFADAPPDWCDVAMHYARRELGGGVCALHPLRGPTIGADGGYDLEDYLQQQGAQRRYHTIVPDQLWDLLPDHVRDLGDVERLADSARIRGLTERATALYQLRFADDQCSISWQFGALLVEQGLKEELRARATRPDEAAQWALLDLLLCGDHADDALELARRCGAVDDTESWYELVEGVYHRGQEETVRVLAAAGDGAGNFFYAQLLEDKGRVDDLRALADTGVPIALSSLATVLEAAGRIDEAIAALDELSEIDGYDGPHECAALLARNGREEELREWADQGLGPARVYLPHLLAEQGREAEVRALMTSDDYPERCNAQRALASLLAAQGREAELRELPDDKGTTQYLVDLLARQEREDDLRRMAEEGNGRARDRLAGLVRQQNREYELRLAAAAGDRSARVHLVALLAEQSRDEDLSQLAAAGDADARRHLAGLPPQWI